MKKYRLGIAGSGYLANIIIDAYEKGMLSDYEIVGVFGRTKEHVDAAVNRVNSVNKNAVSENALNLDAVTSCTSCRTIDELLQLKPDYIAEAASVACLKEIAGPVLETGCSLIVVSIGALADQGWKEQMEKMAREHKAKIYIASGAVGGFDVLRTISLMGQANASFVSRKNPASLKNTPLFKEELLKEQDPKEVFDGSAKEAIAILPTKVNVAVATALASVGPEELKVSIHSEIDMSGDDYVITSEVPEAGVRAKLNIYSATSEIAAWSVVAVLQNIASPIVF